MGGRLVTPLPAYTIPNGTTGSALTGMQLVLSGAIDLVVFAPAVLAETVRLEIAPFPAVGTAITAADFTALQQNGLDITLTAGKSFVLSVVAFAALRFVSTSGNVAADRIIKLAMQEAAGYED